MGYREIFAKINARTVKGILIFHGPEEYVKDRTLEALKAKLVAPDMESLNYDLMDSERANAADIRRAVETLPFMAEQRLIVVRDYAMLTSSTRGSGLDSRAENEELERLCARFPETTVLVFLMRAALDTTKAAFKLLVRKAEVVDFGRLSEDEVLSQIARMCKRNDCAVSRDDARFLMQFAGNDLEMLSHEIDKACAWAGPGANLTRAAIEAVCVQTQEYKVFSLIDDLYAGRGGEAMRKLRPLMADGDGGPGALLSLIERQARLMAAVKAQGKGADNRALAQNLGVQPFALDNAARAAARWSGAALARVIALCARADEQIKQGIMSDESAVELLAMQVVAAAGGKA